jgi:hypothetical protein
MLSALHFMCVNHYTTCPLLLSEVFWVIFQHFLVCAKYLTGNGLVGSDLMAF